MSFLQEKFVAFGAASLSVLVMSNATFAENIKVQGTTFSKSHIAKEIEAPILSAISIPNTKRILVENTKPMACFTTFSVASTVYQFKGEVVLLKDGSTSCNAYCGNGKSPQIVAGEEYKCVKSGLKS